MVFTFISLKIKFYIVYISSWHDCGLRVICHSLTSYLRKVSVKKFLLLLFPNYYPFSGSPGEYLDLMDDSLLIRWFLSLSCESTLQTDLFRHFTFIVAGRPVFELTSGLSDFYEKSKIKGIGVGGCGKRDSPYIKCTQWARQVEPELIRKTSLSADSAK